MIYLSLAFLLCTPAFSLDSRKTMDYQLDVSFYPDEASMTGYARIDLESPPAIDDTLRFYLHGELWVDSVFCNGKNVEFRQEKILYPYDYSRLATATSIPNSENNRIDSIIEIYYQGFMNPSKAAAISNYMRIDEDGVFLRSFGYSVWFPMFPDEFKGTYPVSFSSVRINTPGDFQSIFIGQKISQRIVKDRLITEWQTPEVDLFEVQCTARRFRTLENDGLHLYFTDSQAAKSQASAIDEFVSRIKDIYRNLYGPSRHNGDLYVMQMPQYGDIASANIIGISDQAWRDFETGDRSKRTLAHELVHSFVKVDVDRSDPLYALAVEGFPSYFHLPAMGQMLGEQWYREYLANKEKSYIKMKEAGTDRRGRRLPAEKPIDQITPEEIGIYKDKFILSDRVLLFFNYLKARMGDDTFGQFTRQLFAKDGINFAEFKSLILEYLPDEKENLVIWLSSKDYPDIFKLANLWQ